MEWRGLPNELGRPRWCKGPHQRTGPRIFALRQRWPDRTVTVRLQTNRPPSLETRPNQIISAFSVAEFLRNHWEMGPTAQDSEVLREAWDTIAQHTGLLPDDFEAFVKG